jgi:hypothetical protein
VGNLDPVFASARVDNGAWARSQDDIIASAKVERRPNSGAKYDIVAVSGSDTCYSISDFYNVIAGCQPKLFELAYLIAVLTDA